jgi:hypothetical protein
MQQHVGTDPKQAIGVLPLMINLDAMGVVFDHTHRQTLVAQQRDDALEKGGLARILEAADGNDGWRRRPTLCGPGLQPSEVNGGETVTQVQAVRVHRLDTHPPI